MVNRNYLFLAILVAAVIIGIVSFLYETEEEKVKKVFYVISDSIEKTAEENPIIGAGKMKQIRDVLLDSCSIDIPSHGISRTISSREISSYAYARRTQFKTMSFKFYDVQVDLPDKTNATVTLTAMVKGTLASGEQVEDVHELTGALKKTDTGWRLSKIEIVEILEN